MSTSTTRPLSQHPLALHVLWSIAAVLSWRLIGDHVATRFIGIDPAGISYRGVIIAAAFILPAAVLTFRAIRRALLARRTRGLVDETEREAALERRQFLVNGVAGT